MLKVATSLVSGHRATAELATDAVQLAMGKANIRHANAVLLLLSSEFSSNPQPAILAAASAAQCTQVMGCSATGIFTEEDWVLDSPAVAVMVFGGSIQLENAHHNHAQQPLLTLSAPNAVHYEWLNQNVAGDVSVARYGGVSGDATGHGAFSVWQNAKGAASGHVEAFFSGVEVASLASHGLQILGQSSMMTATESFDLLKVDDLLAWQHLQTSWAYFQIKHQLPASKLPLHLIVAMIADSEEAIHQGHFLQTSIISVDEELGTLTLAQTLQVGQTLTWGLRDPTAAKQDLKSTTLALKNKLSAPPAFGLLFSCLGRGPFQDGIDHDLNTLAEQLPHMPLLGFYGNGEIAQVGVKNQLLPYSVVLSLFTSAINT